MFATADDLRNTLITVGGINNSRCCHGGGEGGVRKKTRDNLLWQSERVDWHDL